MSPTLNPGDTIYASPLPYLFIDPKIDDIVICIDPRTQRILVKRIVKMVKGKYYVSGDNRKSSTDSKKFGLLEKKDIIGKVIYSTQNRYKDIKI